MKRYLLLVVLFAVFLSAKDIQPPIPVMEKINIINENTKLPSPVFDTSLIVNTGATTREVAIGRYFKGLLDDTIRVIGVQSAGTRYLYVCTDTSTTVFGDNKFRIETPYTFYTGSVPNAVALGKLTTSDARTSIFVGHLHIPFSFFRFEWDPTIPGWALKDSIPIGTNDSINDIAVGLVSNTTYSDIFLAIPRSTPSSQIFWLRWNGTSYDSLRIPLSGTQRVKGVAIGDIRPDIPGDEVYVVGGTTIWMLYWDGLSANWSSVVITTGVASAVDVVVGDIDPTLPGNELGVLHASTSYQLSVWNWDGSFWWGRAWNITGSATAYELAIGNVSTDYPGNELIFTSVSTTINPFLFSIAPNGSAWGRYLPKNAAGTTDFGIAIGDVNKFRGMTDEYVLSGGNRFYEGEQILSTFDVGTYYYRINRPISIKNVPQQIQMLVFNAGNSPVTGFTYGYYLKNNPFINYSNIFGGTINPDGYAEVTMDFTPNFTAYDTIIAYVYHPSDGNFRNDTTRMHLEVFDDSTVAASGFNSTVFPPLNATTSEPLLGSDYKWTRYIISGAHNWVRTTAPANPTAPVLESYGVASYPSFNAPAGSSARLLTHRFNVGPIARKVILTFYMYHDNGYSTTYDSIYIEYSFDTLSFNTITGFQRYFPTNGWQKRTVEIGDFSGGTQLYVGFRAVSKYGNNMFIDSVRVFTTTPTAPATDAGIIAVKLPNPPYIVGQSYPVTVTIRNFGLDPLTSCPIYYNWGKNSGLPVSETWTGYLGANQSIDYTFPVQYQPSETGIDTIWAWTELPGDMNNTNDTSYREVNVCPEYHMPLFTENFEGDWLNSTKPPFCGWSIVDGGSENPNIVNNNDWHKFLYTTRNSNVARIFYSPVEWSNDWLISPRLNCGYYGTYTLRYWHYYNDFTTITLDSGNVMLSTDGGANWMRIALYQNADDSGYKSIDITRYVNGNDNVRIGFWYVANDEWWWYIDSFSVDFTPDIEPPSITLIEQPQNTYNNGPYTVKAVITDISKPITTHINYIINDVRITETPISVIGDTFTFQIPDVNQGTIIEYYIFASDPVPNGTSTQRYRFFKLAPIGQNAIFATAQPDSSVSLSWNNPNEVLYYDDGPYYAWFSQPFGFVATQFTPQYTPTKINGFASFFYHWGEIQDSLRFIIWDDNNGLPGNEIFDTTLVPVNYPNLTIIDLSSYNIIIPSGDFHIGFQYYENSLPYFVTDLNSNLLRTKFTWMGDWYYVGSDLCIYAFVDYLPGSKSNTKSVVANIPKGELKEFVKLENITAKKPVFTPKNIAYYEVLRRDVMGGQWVTIGTPNTNYWIDNPTNLTNHTFYEYSVRTVYTNPDSFSNMSPPRGIGIDWSPPAYSNLIVDSVPNYLLPSVEIYDWTTLLYDSLFYSINDGPFVGVTTDSIVSLRYYYTIPVVTKEPVNVKFYFTSQDNSEWSNFARDPIAGYYETTVGITDIIPDRLFLKVSNLVTGKLNVEFGLPKTTNVSFSIYNTLGQKITTIEKGKMKAGSYKEEIKLNIPSGIYFLRLETGEGKIINKLLKVF